MEKDYLEDISKAIEKINLLELSKKVEAINETRTMLHNISPFKNEPVDCVLWIESNKVGANDYNPNVVAPPEMQLLQISIQEDGYTQPIVAWEKRDKQETLGGIIDNNIFEVVDGFHRNRVGKESQEINERIHGYLPITIINKSREEKGDRISSTIRHNRARGKHTVDGMTEIVVELKRRNWTNQRIERELGMEQDEILRLCQITGLSELFTDQEFSKSWDIDGAATLEDFKELSDDVDEYSDVMEQTRTVNTSDESRIFHTYEKWECYKAGLYNTTKEGMNRQQCEQAYCDFLADLPRFEKTLNKVITEWKNSCEHYLSNSAMNRIAWLGQASMCCETGVPSVFCGGFNLLSKDQQTQANEMALKYLNIWLKNNNRELVSIDEATTGRQSDIY